MYCTTVETVVTVVFWSLNCSVYCSVEAAVSNIDFCFIVVVLYYAVSFLSLLSKKNCLKWHFIYDIIYEY